MSFREKWDRLREFNKKGLLVDHFDGRFGVMKTGYRLDRRLFNWAMVLVMLILFGAFIYSTIGGVPLRSLYLKCPESSIAPCENPYYLNCDEEYCREASLVATLRPGESIGTKPDASFGRLRIVAMLGAWGVFVGAILLNHFLYNRGKMPFDLEVDDEK